MSLRAALLALLSAGPLTGYDAAKHFRTSVGQLWHAPDSQIYPELRRMHENGLLDAAQIPWGSGHATKTQYTITEAGRTALSDWQTTPIKYTPERDLAHLVSAYFEWAPTLEDAKNRLNEHLTHHTAVRDVALANAHEIRTRTSATLQRRLATTPPDMHEQIIAFKLFAHEGKQMRAETEIRWAQHGLDLLARLEAHETGASPQ